MVYKYREDIMKLNRSALRIFQIMDFLTLSRKGATLSEIALALDEPKTSIYDLLVTAVHMNYVRKSNKHFYIGSQSKKAGNAYTEREEILDIVSPIILDASQKYNVSVSLVFLDKTTLKYAFTAHPSDAVLVAREDSPLDIIHAAASGKILLAHTCPSNRNKIINTLTFHKFTDKTIASKKELLQELDKVRKQNYAMDSREFNYLLQCIAAPIYKNNVVIASISFSSLNLYIGTPDEKIKEVIATAKHLSHLLSKPNP